MHSHGRFSTGIPFALAAATLFGAGVPLAKRLLGDLSPWMLAGLLYVGSGLGLSVYRWLARLPTPRLTRAESGWLIGAVIAGGGVAPLLLMWGLSRMPASGAALLLNAEGVCTALVAWFAFKEHVDRRIALGMLLIVTGALILSRPTDARFTSVWPALAILGACLAWGIDNNLTRKVALADAVWIASVKGLTAGGVNLALALSLGGEFPGWRQIVPAMSVGLFAYGISLSLFIVALRHLGASRAGAYFSVAPFVGALLAVAMGDALTWQLFAAGLLMASGIWLHVTEHHEHEHTHDGVEHDHEHIHDAHHQHAHGLPVAPGIAHKHVHRHQVLRHRHAHFPDAHHRHDH